MSLNALDTACVLTGHAHEIAALGYDAVGIYARDDRSPVEMVQGLRAVGLRLFSVYERGDPTSVDYFTADQGERDANAAVTWAEKIGQPRGSHLFLAVDYDASFTDLIGAIDPYFEAAHRTIRSANYLCSVYGSGLVCRLLISAGYANKAWLAQSSGWRNYDLYRPHAAIIQGPATTVLGFDCDLDTIVDDSVCW